MTTNLFVGKAMNESEYQAWLKTRSKSVIMVNSTGLVKVQPIIKTNLQIRDDTDVLKLNKTERAFYKYLKSINPPWIGVQCMTLKLGDDCRYTPDFFVLNHAGKLIAHEVKGFWRDDAKVKIKVAARMFLWIEFWVAVKKGSGFEESYVKP